MAAMGGVVQAFTTQIVNSAATIKAKLKKMPLGTGRRMDTRTGLEYTDNENAALQLLARDFSWTVLPRDPVALPRHPDAAGRR